MSSHDEHLRQFVRMAVACGLALLGGCATMSGDPFAVGWARTEQAALDAAKSPWVWAPLAGAAVTQVDNIDHRISNWAVDNTPVFGSVQNAHDWSNYLQGVETVAWLGSVALTPGANGSSSWDAKLRDGMVGLGAIAATGATTELIKVTANRERPDGGHNSFPSGHTSFAAVTDTLTLHELDQIPMSDGARTATTIGIDALTFATGWARIEAGAHYPSDVLVGMSIGNFFGRMFSDAFLGDNLADRLSFAVEPVRGGGEIALSLRF